MKLAVLHRADFAQMAFWTALFGGGASLSIALGNLAIGVPAGILALVSALSLGRSSAIVTADAVHIGSFWRDRLDRHALAELQVVEDEMNPRHPFVGSIDGKRVWDPPPAVALYFPSSRGDRNRQAAVDGAEVLRELSVEPV